MKSLIISFVFLCGLVTVTTTVFSQDLKGSGLHIDGGTAVSGNGKNIILKAQNGVPGSKSNGGNIILHAGKLGGNIDRGGIGINGKVDVRSDLLVSGIYGFNAANQHATVYLGDENNYIKSIHGSGVRIGTYGVGDAITLLQGSGNVGIGMIPDRKLSVNGAIGLKRVDVWDGTDDNDLTWDGYTITREGSSRRYKQNIGLLQEDFRKILKLEAKQYHPREGYGDPEKWSFGYIAEDLEDIGLTRMIIHDTEGRPDGVNYKKLCIYLNEILKAHDLEIAELKEMIQAQQKKIEELDGNRDNYR